MQTTPTTISEAFATWSALDALLDGTDDETFNRLANEQAQIERTAVLLPIRTTRDMFQLLAMTTDDGSEPTEAADALFRRAREGVAPNPVEGTLAAIFDRWLPIAQRVQDGTSTEGEEAEDLSIVAAVAAITSVDPLDVWRKVAMVFDVTDHHHTGGAAALMQEAREALGIKAATRH